MNDSFEFLVQKDITFLNFGSFGSCPKEIFSFYQQKQLELERQPVSFIVEKGIKELNQAREALATYVNCGPDDLVFVINPSYAINTIAKSFPMSIGDEILSTNLEYGALNRTWNYYCNQKGAKFIQQEIPLPISTKEEIVDAFFQGYTKNTKAIFLSEITSSTALILPVHDICIEAKKRGLITIVDGAHVPGQLSLDLQYLQADIYTGACHKWMMAPKGASFLYVHNSQQSWIDPLLISWGYQSDFPSHSRFIDYHQTCGTRDFSAFLTVPFCIHFMENNKWKDVSLFNKNTALEWALNLQDEFGFDPLCPINHNFIGQMFSMPIRTNDPIKLKHILLNDYQIEIPVTQLKDKFFIRYSVQAFNDDSDYKTLEYALKKLQKSKIIEF